MRKRLIFRFLRGVAAPALAALINAAIQQVGTLPISDPAIIALLTGGLLALDKFLRDKGIY